LIDILWESITEWEGKGTESNGEEQSMMLSILGTRNTTERERERERSTQDF